MKKLIFLLFLLPNLISAQNLLAPNKVWKNHHHMGHNIEWDVYYRIATDTPVNGLMYTKVIAYNWQNELQSFFLRTDGKKVYMQNDSVDVLLYDFDLKPGDSISITVAPNHFPAYFYKYVGEDSLLVNGKFEKRITVVTNRSHPIYTTPYLVDWLNNVGDMSYGLLSLYARDFGFRAEFVCLKENNLPIYGSSCNATGIVEEAKRFGNIEVYLSGEQLCLKSETPLMHAAVVLYTIEGKEVMATQMENISNESISIPLIPSGVYLVHMASGTERIVKRVVKI